MTFTPNHRSAGYTAIIARIRTYLAKRRLARSLKPNPAYRKRRLAQFSPSRRTRYLINVQEIGW